MWFENSSIQLFFSSFQEQKFITLMKANLQFFFSWIILLVLRNFCLALDNKYFLIFFKQFHSFNFFNYVHNTFWVNFCARCENEVKIHILYINVHLLHHHWLKRQSFLYWIAFACLSIVSWARVLVSLQACKELESCDSVLIAKQNNRKKLNILKINGSGLLREVRFEGNHYPEIWREGWIQTVTAKIYLHRVEATKSMK